MQTVAELLIIKRGEAKAIFHLFVLQSIEYNCFYIMPDNDVDSLRLTELNYNIRLLNALLL